MDIVGILRQRARRAQRAIVLPEADDERILKATKIIVDEQLARIILLSAPEAVVQKAGQIGLDLNKITLINPLQSPERSRFAQEFYELRKHKGVTPEEAGTQMANYVNFAAMMVRNNLADGFVAGAATTTADVAKAAIYGIGFGERITTISSCFLVSVPDCAYGANGTFVFADCGIIPDPSPSQLANIAASASELFRLLVEEEP
ncbi:MAG: phosphate acetyltransferase, partial [Candidatus Omnitrophica bacterium]|nr:phosphate acetyltransferase [Candidatus Omnitrophota bacterium]